MHNFKELKVWKKARSFVGMIYEVSKSFPLDERYGLVQQMRRSAISIPSNIAEGSGRNSNAQFRHFLDIALGSAYELQTQLFLALDLNYLDLDVHVELDKLISEIQKMLRGLKKRIS